MPSYPRTERLACFGPFSFALREGVLRRGDVVVPLQPQPTELLALLLRTPGRLVTRDEIRNEIWAGRVVEFDAGLNFAVSQVRRALGDDARTPFYVETVHRRGYRFTADVTFSGPEPAGRGRWTVGRLGRAAGIALAAFLLALAGATATRRERSPTPRPTVADALPAAVRTPLDAGRWLLEQGEYERSLLRLDSVRLARPDLAEAWVLTARAHLGLRRYVDAARAAERATELDPTDPRAYFLDGLSHFYRVDPRGALTAFERAVELDPDRAAYHQWHAQALANELRLEEAIEELEALRRSDPVSNLVGVDLASVYVASGRYAEAVEHCTASMELVPDATSWATDCLMTAHHFRGDDASALTQARRLMVLEGALPAEADAVSEIADYFAWDLTRLERLAQAGDPAPAFVRARAHARLGHRGPALAALDELREARDFALQWAPRDVWFHELHGDAAYEAILREAGLPVPPSS